MPFAKKPKYVPPFKPSPPDEIYDWVLRPKRLKYAKDYEAAISIQAFRYSHPDVVLAPGTRRVRIIRVVDKDKNIWERYEGLLW